MAAKYANQTNCGHSRCRGGLAKHPGRALAWIWPGQASNILLNFLPFEYVKRAGSDFAVPHNMLLSVGVGIGLPGVILFLGLYFTVICQLWRGIKLVVQRQHLTQLDTMPGYAILIALILFFVRGMLISIQTEKLMWILMGTAVAYTTLPKNEIAGDNDGSPTQMNV